MVPLLLLLLLLLPSFVRLRCLAWGLPGLVRSLDVLSLARGPFYRGVCEEVVSGPCCWPHSQWCDPCFSLLMAVQRPDTHTHTHKGERTSAIATLQQRAMNVAAVLAISSFPTFSLSALFVPSSSPHAFSPFRAPYRGSPLLSDITDVSCALEWSVSLPLGILTLSLYLLFFFSSLPFLPPSPSSTLLLGCTGTLSLGSPLPCA